ncbi:unnamed protein product [Mytilus edulis]|uniref:CCHC-type domain-containing protein n=1 Tax=Mytilus edulis TaxID=6550 RepID=A0A8S3V6M4_MYTED|nr:unnamed protein product [Mytilus edulis]
MSKENTISEEDFALLQLLKKEVKQKPKGDDVQGLKDWMKEYLATSGEIVTPKEESQEKETSKTKTTVTYTKMRDPPKRDHEERKTSKKPQTAKAAAISEPINNTSEFEEVKGLIQQLTTRFDRMETDYRGRGRGYINYRGQNNNRYTDTRQRRWQDQSKPQASSANQDERRCFRCGKPGHLKLGCIEKLDKDGAYIDSLAVNPTVIPSQEEDIPDTETVDWAAAQAMDTTIKSLINESSDESSDESVDYFDVDYVLERTVDSEPTFTDEPAVDVTEPAQDAFIPLGDAQPEGNQGPEMETASGSASDIVGEVIPQEDTLVEQEEQPQELEMSPVPVRRSGRDRKPPAWISSGLYDISAIGTTSVGHTITEEHSKPTAEWQEKAEYITSLARTPLFSGLQREAALAILDIVNHH